MSKTLLQFLEKPKGMLYFVKIYINNMFKTTEIPEKVLTHNPKVNSYYPNYWNNSSDFERSGILFNHFNDLRQNNQVILRKY